MATDLPITDFASASVLLGVLFSTIFGLVAFLLFSRSRNQNSQSEEVASEAPPSPKPAQTGLRKAPAHSSKRRAPAAPEKGHLQHPLFLNTLKGHTQAVNGICFTSNGRGIATASADGVVRVFRLDDASSKNIKFLHLNTPSGSCPTAVAFGEGASQLLVAAEDISGASLYMYAAGGGKVAAEAKAQGKLPPPEIKWEKHQVHDRKNIITIASAAASYGSGDGSILVASCSEGTDIKLWLAADGKCVGAVDTNQLKNTMATLSPNGRFLAAAAFTADVKVWEIVYGKDGSVREVSKVMQLKGHKSAVTWLSFTSNSDGIVTASKDGSVRVWNINVRYQLDEDPKCLKVLPIQVHDVKDTTPHYDRISVSPDNKTLAVTYGSTLQWLSLESGEVLDRVEIAHSGFITCLAWAPDLIPTEKGRAAILATASSDKKVKLWLPPR